VSGDFLSRWSRRKLEVKREDEAPAPADAPPSTEVDAPAEELSPEELAALPAIESLTAESDIAAFLRKGVPQALRNAALRRAWALDPEIRDYVGHARDYGYDWNVPGGVPGTGPLDPGTDIARMVEDVFGKSHEPGPDAQLAQEHQDGPAAHPSLDAETGAPKAGPDGEASAEALPVQSSSTVGDLPPGTPKPRHGGAKPA
jgi:hypothetical protein